MWITLAHCLAVIHTRRAFKCDKPKYYTHTTKILCFRTKFCEGKYSGIFYFSIVLTADLNERPILNQEITYVWTLHWNFIVSVSFWLCICMVMWKNELQTGREVPLYCALVLTFCSLSPHDLYLISHVVQLKFEANPTVQISNIKKIWKLWKI